MESGKLFLAVIAIFAIVAGSAWAVNSNALVVSSDVAEFEFAPLERSITLEDNSLEELKIVGPSSDSNGCFVKPVRSGPNSGVSHVITHANGC